MKNRKKAYRNKVRQARKLYEKFGDERSKSLLDDNADTFYTKLRNYTTAITRLQSFVNDIIAEEKQIYNSNTEFYDYLGIHPPEELRINERALLRYREQMTAYYSEGSGLGFVKMCKEINDPTYTERTPHIRAYATLVSKGQYNIKNEHIDEIMIELAMDWVNANVPKVKAIYEAIKVGQ